MFHPSRAKVRRGCAPRRRLFFEACEARRLLASAPTGTDATFFVFEDSGNHFAAADFGFTDPPNTPPHHLLDVTPVHHSPQGLAGHAGKLLQVGALSVRTLTISDFGFTDPADMPTPDRLKAVVITSGITPQLGTLTLDGVNVTSGTVVSAAQIQAGGLRYTAPPVQPGVPTSFKIRVQDDGGTAGGGSDLDAVERTLTIHTGQALFQPPAGTSSAITAVEDIPYLFQPVDFGFSDPDVPANNFTGLRVSSLPTAGTLSVGGIAVFAGDLVSISDILVGAFRYTPPPIAHGQSLTSFTFRVQDDGGTASGGQDLDPIPRTMTINLTSGANREPKGFNHTVTGAQEDTPYVFQNADFLFDDGDGGAQSLLAVKITTLPERGWLTLDDVAITAEQSIWAGDVAAGKLRYLGSPNFSGSPYASFQFQVQDNGGTAVVMGVLGVDLDSTLNTLTINVLPVNDPPSGADKIVAIDEDAGYNFAAIDFGFNDGLDGVPFQSAGHNSLAGVVISSLSLQGGTLQLSGADVLAGRFVPAAELPALQFRPAANANDGNRERPLFSFQVRDDGLGNNTDLSPNTITFSLRSVNDPPRGAFGGSSVSVNGFEDRVYTIGISDFGFTDPNDNPDNGMAEVRIGTLPDLSVGLLTLSGAPLAAGDMVPSSLISDGQLRFVPAPDAFGSPLARLVFRVQDNGGISSGGQDVDDLPRTLGINIASVNDPPSGSSTVKTIGRDSIYTLGASDFGFQDPADSHANTLIAVQITALPHVGSLLIAGAPVTLGGWITVADINGGQLRYVPPVGMTGTPLTSIHFRVQDNGGTANGGQDVSLVENTFTISIQNTPCGAPVRIIDKIVVGREDTEYVFSQGDFSVDPESPAQTTVTVTSLPEVGTLLYLGAAVVAPRAIPVSELAFGVLKYLPPADANGPELARFKVDIGNGGFCDPEATGTITIGVSAVNDAPGILPRPFEVSASDDGGPQTFASWADLLTGPADEVEQTPTIVVQSNSNAELFSVLPQVDAVGTLTFTPRPNARGTAQITVVAKDTGGTANGGSDTSVLRTFTIEVTKPHPMHNTLLALDVTRDGKIAPADALAVVNYLNAFGAGPVPATVNPGTLYYDSDGDDFLAPRDVLNIIDYLNARPSAPEGVTRLPAVTADGEEEALLADLMGMLAADVAAVRRKR